MTQRAFASAARSSHVNRGAERYMWVTVAEVYKLDSSCLLVGLLRKPSRATDTLVHKQGLRAGCSPCIYFALSLARVCWAHWTTRTQHADTTAPPPPPPRRRRERTVTLALFPPIAHHSNDCSRQVIRCLSFLVSRFLGCASVTNRSHAWSWSSSTTRRSLRTSLATLLPQAGAPQSLPASTVVKESKTASGGGSATNSFSSFPFRS